MFFDYLNGNVNSEKKLEFLVNNISGNFYLKFKSVNN
jgi:hypothetical protein